MAESPAPNRTTVLFVLLTAAVIGFLAGALVAVTGGPGTSDPAATGSPAVTPSPTATSTPTSTTPVDAEIRLDADRAAADTDELIRLEGVVSPAGAGRTLQVQQSVDGIGFVDFPVTATTRNDGSFGVWVRTGRVGTNEFRMVTTLDGQQVVSNAVTVQIS